MRAAECECECEGSRSSNCACSCSAQHAGGTKAKGNGHRGGTDEVSGRYSYLVACAACIDTDTDVRQSKEVSCCVIDVP